MSIRSPFGPTVLVVRRRWLGRALLWLAVAVLALGLVVGALGAAAWQTVPELSQMVEGLRITIDGHPIRIGSIDPMHVWVGGVLLVVLLALLLALLPLVLGVAALAIVAAVAMALLAAAGVLALVLSPLIAVGLLAWWLLRRKPASSQPRTTMAS